MWSDEIASVADDLYIANRKDHVEWLTAKIEKSVASWRKDSKEWTYMTDEDFKVWAMQLKI